MIRVLVATALELRSAIEALLERAPDILLVRQRSDVRHVTSNGGADVVIVDADGNAPWPGAAAVVLLADRPGNVWVDALRAGARAVVSTRANAEQLLAAVRAANAGLAVLPASLARGLTDGTPHRAGMTGEPAEPLSPREEQILRMLAEGLGNKSIAGRLGISRNTVKAHVSSIFAKLGAGSRAEAVAIGARTGLIIL